MERESFTLLNLTASESESVPDLDLVLPASRKQNKRKVKLKRRERSASSKPPKPLSTGGGASNGRETACCCSCHSSSCLRLGGGLTALLVAGGLLAYAGLLYNSRLVSLERRLIALDDSSKSVPETILQLQALLDKIQENHTVVVASIERLGERLTSLEKEANTRPEGQPQANIQGIQQGLADLGGKLTEVKQSAEAASSRATSNAQNIIKLENELNNLKLNEIDMKNGGGGGGGSEEITMTGRSSITVEEVKQLVDEVGLTVSRVNQSLASISYNTTARLDWIDRDVAGLQAKYSQMEDDNRNMSSRVGSLAVTCTSDLQQIRKQVDALAGDLRVASAQLQAAAAHTSPPPRAPSPDVQPPPALSSLSLEVQRQQQPSLSADSEPELLLEPTVSRAQPEVGQLASSDEQGVKRTGPRD